MLNNRVLSQLEQVFASLSSSVMLLDEAGNSLIPAEDIRFLSMDIPEEIWDSLLQSLI